MDGHTVCCSLLNLTFNPMAAYLSKAGLTSLWAKIKAKFLLKSGGTISGALTVNGTLAARNGVELYGGTPYIDFHYNSTTTDYTSRIIEEANGRLAINDIMYVNRSTGQVAIGTTWFDQKFRVEGACVFGQNNNYSLYAAGGLLHNDPNGNAGYNISGNGYATFVQTVTATSFSQSSDRRVKRNIRDVGAADMRRAMNVRMVGFRFVADKEKMRHYGVIAQELEEAGLGHLVRTNEKGMKSVDYTALLCLKIAMLEKRLAELEKGKVMIMAKEANVMGWIASKTKNILRRWIQQRKQWHGE